MTTIPEAPPQKRGLGLSGATGSRFKYQDWALFGVIVILLIVGTILKGSEFASKDNIFNVLRQGSVDGVLAIGMTFVIATAGIDLSVGSAVAAPRIAGGLFISHGHGSFLFIVGAVAMGIALGAINGAAVSYGKVVPFIATLAMLLGARGLALWMSGKTPISLFDQDFLRWFGIGEVLTIPSALIVFAAVAIVGWVLLNRTPYGRYVVAVGGNTEAARIAGVKVNRIVFSVYVLSGVCVGIATILLCGRLASASPVAGNLYELDAIAAVVIGGTSLAGGRASIVGTVMGVITFALVFNLLTLMNLAIEIQQVVKGLIILAAVLLQRRSN
jgi:ribose transport system permease protein